MTLWLEDRAILAISGPEARDFLQGLVTNDVRGVGLQSLRYATLLTPQGKILFDFLLSESAGELLLDCLAAAREPLARRLSLYRLRAKVQITPRDDLAVVWRREEPTSPLFLRDPRHPDLGYRAVMSRVLAPASCGAEVFKTLRLAHGVPEGSDFGQDKFFALDAGLDELGGIAFDKGCYVGQELTARMKHRGTARKRLLPVTTASGAPLPAAGTAIIANEREVGTLTSSYGASGFALIRLDKLEEAGDTPLLADGVEVHVTKPDWLCS